MNTILDTLKALGIGYSRVFALGRRVVEIEPVFGVSPRLVWTSRSFIVERPVWSDCQPSLEPVYPRTDTLEWLLAAMSLKIREPDHLPEDAVLESVKGSSAVSRRLVDAVGSFLEGRGFPIEWNYRTLREVRSFFVGQEGDPEFEPIKVYRLTAIGAGTAPSGAILATPEGWRRLGGRTCRLAGTGGKGALMPVEIQDHLGVDIIVPMDVAQQFQPGVEPFAPYECLMARTVEPIVEADIRLVPELVEFAGLDKPRKPNPHDLENAREFWALARAVFDVI